LGRKDFVNRRYRYRGLVDEGAGKKLHKVDLSRGQASWYRRSPER